MSSADNNGDRINWDQFKYIDFKINQKTGEKYFQQYLVPSYYLEVFFYSVEPELLLEHFDYACDKISDQFIYHHNNTKSNESKMKDKQKTFKDFKSSIKSKKYVWSMFSKNAGSGSHSEIGGASDATFSCWFHKKSTNDLKNDIEIYKTKLVEYDTKILPIGIKVSVATVCLPVDAFESEASFKSWVLNSPLVKSSEFHSGSAGYRVNYWSGYINPNAKSRLKEVLLNAPGFDYEIPVVSAMGRVLTPDQHNILPIVKRPNWLTLISNLGLTILGGEKSFRSKIEKDESFQITNLSGGVCIQTQKKPALFAGDKALMAYYDLGNLLEPLKFVSHEKDSYSSPDHETAKQWLCSFYKV